MTFEVDKFYTHKFSEVAILIKKVIFKTEDTNTLLVEYWSKKKPRVNMYSEYEITIKKENYNMWEEDDEKKA